MLETPISKLLVQTIGSQTDFYIWDFENIMGHII